MRRNWIAVGMMVGAVTLAPAASAQTIEKRVQFGALGKALLSVRNEPERQGVASRSEVRHGPASGGKARIAMLTDTGDQLGLGVARSRQSASRSVSAIVGLWGDARSIEFGAFRDRSAVGTAQTVRQATGRRVESRGVRLTGALYGTAGDSSPGWTVAVDARHQRMPDPAEALRGARSTDTDSRLSINGKLRF